MGPFVPSDTFRRYQCEADKFTAKVATVHGVLSTHLLGHEMML